MNRAGDDKARSAALVLNSITHALTLMFNASASITDGLINRAST
jgi:hypothetical protein